MKPNSFVKGGSLIAFYFIVNVIVGIKADELLFVKTTLTLQNMFRSIIDHRQLKEIDD